jgi:hypothetical protein
MYIDYFVAPPPSTCAWRHSENKTTTFALCAKIHDLSQQIHRKIKERKNFVEREGKKNR